MCCLTPLGQVYHDVDHSDPLDYTPEYTVDTVFVVMECSVGKLDDCKITGELLAGARER